MPSFDLAGPPDAPAIVFLHGAAFTRRMWLPQMDALAGEFRVIALDLPGHGAAAGRPFRLDQAVRDVVAVVDEHTQGRALLVGLSLGGYVAMVVARRSPCRTTGLVLSGCSVVYRGLRGGLARLNALLLRVYSERWLTRMNERTLRQMLPPALAEPQIAAGFYWKAAGQGFGTIAGDGRPPGPPRLSVPSAHPEWRRRPAEPGGGSSVGGGSPRRNGADHRRCRARRQPGATGGLHGRSARLRAIARVPR